MKTIEKHIMDIYTEIKKELPGLHHISFEVTHYHHSSKTATMGYMHVGEKCILFDSVTEIQDYIKETKERRAENEILFRKF